MLLILFAVFIIYINIPFDSHVPIYFQTSKVFALTVKNENVLFVRQIRVNYANDKNEFHVYFDLSTQTNRKRINEYLTARPSLYYIYIIVTDDASIKNDRTYLITSTIPVQ